MRPGPFVLLALLLGASLSGCTGNSDEPGATTPPPTRVLPSRPGEGPSMPTIVEPNATIRVIQIRALDANATMDVGLPAAFVARAANDGPDRAPLEVTFALVGAEAPTVLARGDSVDAGVEGDVHANLTLPRMGNFTMRASADGSEVTMPIVVVGPRIAQLTIDAFPVEPCGDVLIKSSFRNMGDGRARNARADVSFSWMNGTKIADYATAIGDVAPGQLAESEAQVSELRSPCAGEEPRMYQVRFVVHVDDVPDAQLTGVVAV